MDEAGSEVDINMWAVDGSRIRSLDNEVERFFEVGKRKVGTV